MTEEALADLKTRLRVALKFDHADLVKVHKLNLEAADAITALQAERDHWRKLAGEDFHNEHSLRKELATAEAEVENLKHDMTRALDAATAEATRAEAAEQRCARLEAALRNLLGPMRYGEVQEATGDTPFILSWEDIRAARAALEDNIDA